MAAIYSNGGNPWNILGLNFTKRDALSSVYKISMVACDSFRQNLCSVYKSAFTLKFFTSDNFTC